MALRIKGRMARLKQRLVEREFRRAPRGIVRFPKQILVGLPFEWGEVRRLMEHCHASEIMFFHGCAMRVNGKAVLVTGPQGVGKSTAMRILSREGKVQPIGDGAIIVAKTPSGFRVIGSGNYELEKRYSQITKALRGGRIYKSPFASRRITGLGFRLRNNLGKLISRAGAVIHLSTLRDGSARAAEIPEAPLGKVVFLEHEREEFKIKRITGQDIQNMEISDAKRELGGKVKIVEIQSNEKGLRKRLPVEILSG